MIWEKQGGMSEAEFCESTWQATIKFVVGVFLRNQELGKERSEGMTEQNELTFETGQPQP